MRVLRSVVLEKKKLQILAFISLYKPTAVRRPVVKELSVCSYCIDLLYALLMEEVGYVASSKVHILGLEFVITFQVEILH